MAWRVEGSHRYQLDVAEENRDAVRFYVREGFVKVTESHVPTAKGVPAIGMLRMERAV